MSKYYGHHPSPDIADPSAISAELDDRYTKTETDSLVATVSAATLDEANNGWFKENFTMTTITSGASGRPIGIVFDESVVFFKVHIVAMDNAPGAPGDAAAWHLEAAFQKSVPTDARQLGPTIAVLEVKDDPNWDADFGLQGIAQEVVEIQVTGTVGTTIRWTISVEWFMGGP